MRPQDAERVADYFSRRGTVTEWWNPEEGPLAFHYAAELRVLEDALAVDPSWQVLDVGTGPGRFGLWFASKGCRVIGVDLNPEMQERARESARHRGLESRFEVRAGRAEDLHEFEPSRFDVVLCMELFDHLPDLAAALVSMRRVLAPGGRFLFTYVPRESLYGMLGNVYRAWKSRRAPQELMISRTYGFAEVVRALRAAGLELERHFGVGALCVSAQTRFFGESAFQRAATALARAEARRWPYHEGGFLGRRGAHGVGIARAASGPA
ncbi:MAG TPA: class I SAM-dependent methyltransferase [Myxococcota bacterium]|nr:class I SAM-dependent methyltransferase [Myxococcota bacterium]